MGDLKHKNTSLEAENVLHKSDASNNCNTDWPQDWLSTVFWEATNNT